MKMSKNRGNNQAVDLMYRRRYEEWGKIYVGDLFCNNSGLTSLCGAPVYIDGGFYCDNNHLTSLEGAPCETLGDFFCSSNKLTSLKGAPPHVGLDFYCSSNELTSLEGAPTKVNGGFYCHNNPITSLAGIDTYFKNGFIEGQIGIPASIESHILGVLLIPRLQSITVIGVEVDIDTSPLINAANILNKHLAGDRDILDCQEELRAAGLREFGKL